MSLRCLLVLALVAASSAEEAAVQKPCFLLGGDAAAKPFPSLTQCYKQNQQACCVSAHDATIEGEYGGVLSGTCIREYADLEQYYCLGCSPDADSFIEWYNNTIPPATLGDGNYREYTKYDGDDAVAATHEADHLDPAKVSNAKKKVNGKYGEIKLCKSFAERLMYAHGQDGKMVDQTGSRVDAYDGCGVMLGAGDMGVLSRTHFALQAAELDADGVAGKDVPGMGVKYSHEWKFFNELRPPYYGTSDFEISWYHKPAGADSTDGPGCFGAATSLQVASMSVALVAFVARQLA